ncbi:MAG: hypothetical protein KC505_06545 [Myxococcales bacterium]|nr:hypothetical protein [Myxococcales bacterium]
MKKVLNTKQLNTRLPIHMVQQLKFLASERGVTEGSVVEAALREFLGKTQHEEILLKKSDKISRQIERLRRENNVILEVLSTFIKVYLTYVQDIPEHEKIAAELKGARKYSRFLKLISETLEAGKPFFDELEQKRFEEKDFVPCR